MVAYGNHTSLHAPKRKQEHIVAIALPHLSQVKRKIKRPLLSSTMMAYYFWNI